MDFERTTNNRVVVLNVNLIRATLKEAEEFKNQLMEEISNGNKKIVVNLSRCEFIDSTLAFRISIS